MKIAMIGQKGIPARWGGVERHVEELSKVLAKRGHRVLVYARIWYTADAPTPQIENVTVIQTPTIHTKHLDAIVHTFTSTLHAIWSRADVIHYHGVGPSLLSFIPRIFSPRTTVIATFHCIDRYHQKWGALARAILCLGEWAACAFPHQTIAVSKTIRDYCINEYRAAPNYIPNGVGIPAETSDTALAEFGLEPGKFVTMIARLVPHKGAHYLIAAWQKARGLRPDLFNDKKLAIVGASTFTDAYVAELKKQADDDGDIIFTGWQTGAVLGSLYAEAAFLVHPSESEGMPLTVLEAMAHGTAVLVSDIAEHTEFIHSPDQLFPSTNVTALAKKMIALFSNKTLTNALGRANQAEARRHFAWGPVADATIQLYKKPLSTGAVLLTPQKI